MTASRNESGTGEEESEELPPPGPGWYVIRDPHQDPAHVVSGPHNTAEKAARTATLISGEPRIMHTPALVNAVKNEGYNVRFEKGADKPDSLQEDESVEECPQCGSTAVTQKGATVEYAGDREPVDKHWDECINCGWSNA